MFTMVFVFGVDAPLFEILLVFVVLLTAGLIFILLELKKLNQYLMQERSDIGRFERDIGTLEQEEHKLDQEEYALDRVRQQQQVSR